MIDYQTSAAQIIPNSARKIIVTNVGYARSHGIKADVTAKISSAIEFTSSLSYNDAHYVSFTNGPPGKGSAPLTQDLSGRPLPLAPAWTLFAALKFVHPVAQGMSAYVEGELALKSGNFGYPDDSVYSRVLAMRIENLQLGMTVDRVDMALWVNNIWMKGASRPVFLLQRVAADIWHIAGSPARSA